MKKLMIALGAAASMAWCANAVESQVVSAINFNGQNAGDPLSFEAESGKFYWETEATEISSTIKAKESDASDKYLAVDETVPLYRTMNGHDANHEAATGTSLLASNVYFTADVQFTASDETSSAGMVADGDKLLVWLRATEAVEADPENNIEAVPAATNLIITAAATDAGTTATDYIVDSSVVIDPATWYTLTIKAVQGGSEGLEAAAFTVELNGKQLSATAEDASEAKTTFNSLVAYTDGAATTITSVGFKGTGSLDNLEFGTFTEGDAQKCTVSISVTDEEGKMLGIMVDGSEPEELPCEKEYTIASGAKSTIVVTVDDGYVVTYNNTTYNPDDEMNCTIEIDLSAAEPNDTVNVVLAVVEAGDVPVNYTVTVTPVANASYTVQAGGVDVSVTENVATVSSNATVVITATAAQGYEFATAADGWTLNGTTATYTIEGIAANATVTLPTATQSSQTTWPAAWTDSTGYAKDYATKLSAWATANNVADVSALSADAEDAFLLNVAPDAADKTLKVDSIIIEDGKVKITTSPASTGVNGKVYLYKGDSPTSLTKQADAIDGGDLTTIPYDTNKGEQFYKVEVGY